MSKNNDQPDAEILAQFLLPERAERLAQVLEKRTSSLTIVLDHVQNYHNISAVLRSADAFGLAQVHVIGKEFDFSRRIALGTERWLRIYAHQSASAAAQYLHQQDFRVVVLQPEEHKITGTDAAKMPVTSLPFEERLALVFGNEKDGVSRELLAAADVHAYIPMAGFVESLNISVACAICLFCSTIAPTFPQKRTKPLCEEEKRDLRAEWLRNGVKRSEVILREVALRKEWPASITDSEAFCQPAKRRALTSSEPKD